MKSAEEHTEKASACVDMLLVMQELGRGLVAEPYFSTVFAAEFIKRAGGEAHLPLLEAVASGSLKLAAALGELESRHDLTSVRMKAQAAADAPADTASDVGGSGFVLTGRKSVVAFGAQADRLIVSARVSEGDDGLRI